jgi:hypothetical protein
MRLSTQSIGRDATERGIALVTVLVMVSLLAVIGITVNRAGGVGSIMSRDLLEKEQAYYTAVAGNQHALFLLEANPTLVGYVFKDALDQPIRIPFAGGSYGASVADSSAPMGDILISADGITGGNVRAAVEKRRYPMAGQVYVYPPVVKDTYIDGQNELKNFGGDEELLIGANTPGVPRRALLEFDLSGIPPGVTIVSANLEVYMFDNHNAPEGTTVDLEVHRVTRSWEEGTRLGGGNSNGASWEEYDGILLWTTLGADFDPAVETVTTIVVDAIEQWHSWDIKALVQYWVDNPSEQYGLLLKDLDEATDDSSESFVCLFYSREASASGGSLKPRLSIDYE